MPRKTFDLDAAAGGGRLASMRPRPDAAENRGRQDDDDDDDERFNEAAARCRGKPHEQSMEHVHTHVLQ